MVKPAFTGDIAVDGQVVRWIGEDRLRLRAIEQPSICRSIKRISTEDPMRAGAPQIAGAADNWFLSYAGKLVCGIPLRFPGRQIGSFDPEIDLGHREASRLKGKVEVDCCEVPKPLSKETVVPGGKLGQAIICNGVGGGLLGGEVLRPDHRDLLASQVLHGQHAPVTSQ